MNAEGFIREKTEEVSEELKRWMRTGDMEMSEENERYLRMGISYGIKIAASMLDAISVNATTGNDQGSAGREKGTKEKLTVYLNERIEGYKIVAERNGKFASLETSEYLGGFPDAIISFLKFLGFDVFVVHVDDFKTMPKAMILEEFLEDK